MAVTLETIKKAKTTIENSIKRTPLIECPTLEKMTGGKVLFKLENLQKTGSFKLRGALNRIANLTEEEKAKGVIASSAGNHAQGIANRRGESQRSYSFISWKPCSRDSFRSYCSRYKI